MKKLNDKQKKFLLKIQRMQILESIKYGLPDLTEGDDEAELMASGNYWPESRFPIRVIRTVLQDGTYSDGYSQVLNAISTYYKKHYLE